MLAEVTERPHRTYQACSKHWGKLQKACTAFLPMFYAHNNPQGKRESGWNESDAIDGALAAYEEKFKSKFQLLDASMVFLKYPKFRATIEAKKQAQNKGKSDEAEVLGKRPVGRDKTKAKMKKNGDSLTYLLLGIYEFHKPCAAFDRSLMLYLTVSSSWKKRGRRRSSSLTKKEALHGPFRLVEQRLAHIDRRIQGLREEMTFFAELKREGELYQSKFGSRYKRTALHSASNLRITRDDIL